MTNQKRMTETKLEKTLQAVVKQHSKFKNVYFWNSPGSAFITTMHGKAKQYSQILIYVSRQII